MVGVQDARVRSLAPGHPARVADGQAPDPRRGGADGGRAQSVPARQGRTRATDLAVAEEEDRSGYGFTWVPTEDRVGEYIDIQLGRHAAG